MTVLFPFLQNRLVATRRSCFFLFPQNRLVATIVLFPFPTEQARRDDDRAFSFSHRTGSSRRDDRAFSFSKKTGSSRRLCFYLFQKKQDRRDDRAMSVPQNRIVATIVPCLFPTTGSSRRSCYLCSERRVGARLRSCHQAERASTPCAPATRLNSKHPRRPPRPFLPPTNILKNALLNDVMQLKTS
jgi:hypothetical protein